MSKPNGWDKFVRGLASYQGLLLVLIVLGVYGLGVIWAAGLVMERTRQAPKAAVVAAAKLPKGHLLRPADVRLPGLEGYVKRDIEAGKPVAAEDLKPAPDLHVPAGSMLAVLPVDAALLDIGRADHIDVGSTVQICGKDKKALSAVVQAVMCTGGTCSVALPIRTDAAGALNQATARAPSSKPCG